MGLAHGGHLCAVGEIRVARGTKGMASDTRAQCPERAATYIALLPRGLFFLQGGFFLYAMVCVTHNADGAEKSRRGSMCLILWKHSTFRGFLRARDLCACGLRDGTRATSAYRARGNGKRFFFLNTNTIHT